MFKEFRTLIPSLKKYKFWYLAGFICLLLTNSAQIYIPQLVKAALDDLQNVVPTVITLGLTALVVALGRVGWRYFIIGAARRIERDLRDTLFTQFTRLGPGFYGKNRTGDLMARGTNDLDAVRMSVGMAFVAFIDGVFLSTSIIVILLSTEPVLGLYTILPLPIITLLILAFGGRVGQLFKKVQDSFAGISHQAQEILSGIRVIQSFWRQQAFSARFETANQDYVSRNLELTRLWGLFFPLIGLLSGVTTLILLWYGGSLVMEGKLTPGQFAAWLSYLGMLVWPMLGAGMTVNMIQRGAASLKRINEVLATEPDIRSPESPKPFPPRVDLEVRNLTWSYPDASAPVLQNLSFHLKPGEILGILGRTGSGKSTLLRLLPRLLDPPPATVFLGGTDIRDLDLSELRRQFSLVPQFTFLFSDSIRNNIRFANPDDDSDSELRLGELAALDRDVAALEKGWDTPVGERGVSLSGGQKQRVSLARALNTGAPFLLLDDAMASVDVETEGKILTHIQTQAVSRGIILVSHRISTLKKANHILVLDQGRIIQSGSHESLVQEEGVYREIAVLQHETQEDQQ